MRRPRLQRRKGAGEHHEKYHPRASQREYRHVEREAGHGLEVPREADRCQRREREGEGDRGARGHRADRDGTGDVNGEELATGHPQRPQRRMRRGRSRGQPEECRSQHEKREQCSETTGQPERLGFVVERALNLGGVVALRATIRSSGPSEGGKAGGAVPKLDGDEEVRILDVEAVSPVERLRQRDRPDRVGLRRRLDPDDPQPDQGADRDDLRERLDDVPADARPERVRERVRAKAERHPLERGEEVSPLVPQRSAGHLGIGDIGIAPSQAGEARTLSQADVEPVDLALRPCALGRALARDPDLPDLAPLRQPSLCGILVPRIAVEDR